MASKTEIANLALSHLGNGKEVANVDTENSAEARAIRAVWTFALLEVLRAFHWPFANKRVRLALVDSREEQEDENNWIYEFEYAYQYPADCANLIKILSGIRNETDDIAVPYKIVNGDTGQLILTDKDDAVMEYTARVTDTSLFPPDFAMAFSFLLASYAAPRILAGDPGKIGDRVLQFYDYYMRRAQANALNEQRRDPSPDAELIRARG